MGGVVGGRQRPEELDRVAVVEAKLGLGVCAQRLGNLDEAERAYNAVLEAEPANPYALANRAEVRLLRERKDDARADLTAALAALEGRKHPDALRKRVEALRELAGARGLSEADR